MEDTDKRQTNRTRTTYIARVFVSLFLFTSLPSFSQYSQKIDSFMLGRMRERHIPGLAFAVIRDGQVLQKSVYGFADVEHHMPVTEHSVFEIASMSKQFTCAAILLLEEDKILSLTDPLSKFFPDIPKTWKNITLYHLMNHTSGLRDDWDEPTSYFYENHTDVKMRFAQQKSELLFGPGESFHYSSGPFFLGLVIEKVTGRHYSKFLKDRIFDPLNMNHTSVYDDSTIIPERVSGYWWKNDKLENGVDLPPAAEGRADIGLITCLDDMIKWCNAISGNSSLGEKLFNKMFSAGVLNNVSSIPYGLGWYIYPFRTKLLYEHGGAFRTGFNSRIMVFPEDKIQLVLLSNLWRAGMADISYDLAEFFLPDFKVVSPDSTAKDESIKLTRYFEDIFRTLSDRSANRSVLYNKVNVSGFEYNEIADMLQGFSSLTLIKKLKLNVPMVIYGKNISQIFYYKAEAAKPTIWAFYMTKDMKLVSINVEF